MSSLPDNDEGSGEWGVESGSAVGDGTGEGDAAGFGARIAVAAPKPLRTLRRTIEQAYGHLAHEVRYVRDLIYVTVHSSRWGKIAGGVVLAIA